MADDKRSAALEQRLVAVEATLVEERTRATKRRRTGWALLLSFCALGAATQKFPLVITTRRLEIVDDAGRVVLAASAGSGGGALELFDPAGQTVASLRAGNKDGGLRLYDSAGRPMVSVSSSLQGGIARFHHQEGAVVATTGAMAEGGGLFLADAEGNRALELSGEPTGGTARLSHAGEPRLALTAAEVGSRADFHGTTEQPSIRISVNDQSSRLSILGRDEASTWQAFDVAATAEGTDLALTAPGNASALNVHSESNGSWLAIEREAVTSFRIESFGQRVGLWLMDLAGQEIFGVASGSGLPYDASQASAGGDEPQPLTQEAWEAQKNAEFRAEKMKERLQSWEPTDPALLKNKAAMARKIAQMEGTAPAPKGGAKQPAKGKQRGGGGKTRGGGAAGTGGKQRGGGTPPAKKRRGGG